MKSKVLLFIFGAVLVAGMLSATGCYKVPTAPTLVTSGGGSGCPGGHVDGYVDDYDSDLGGGTDSGSISGTISNSSSGAVSVVATDVVDGNNYYLTTVVSNGAYTISQVSDGTYDVSAVDGITLLTYSSEVTVSGGAAVTGIDFSF
ncbi:hypothetical protein K8S19_08455 [bacterium]|nr:hypothetical protein [bacterium]